MARRTRVEYPGACYHVMNRGNYKSWIFESDGACDSFLGCLDECCLAQGWIVHAWVVMGNHYHLCIETPHANLVPGMKWLQSTFANRFNRFRKENGHVFQGRYKAILLDDKRCGDVCHYIHLNPVRAGLVTCEELSHYKLGSFYRLWRPRKRRAYESFACALLSAGGLKDTPAGRSRYLDYLRWLAQEDDEKKRIGFDKMSRGWIKGSNEFRESVLNTIKVEKAFGVTEAEAADMREVLWERATVNLLCLLNKTEKNLVESAKTASWKVAMARLLRERYLTPHRWIAKRLHMGRVSTVQSAVSRHRTRNTGDDKSWRKVKKHETLG